MSVFEETKFLMDKYNVHPNKNLGQNFLIDENASELIASSAIKEDTVIEILAEEATKKGYQVLSFDLPEHGERKSDSTPCKAQICVNELSMIMDYAKKHWNEVNLFACSMGAYFSLLAYKNYTIILKLEYGFS